MLDKADLWPTLTRWAWVVALAAVTAFVFVLVSTVAPSGVDLTSFDAPPPPQPTEAPEPTPAPTQGPQPTSVEDGPSGSVNDPETLARVEALTAEVAQLRAEVAALQDLSAAPAPVADGVASVEEWRRDIDGDGTNDVLFTRLGDQLLQSSVTSGPGSLERWAALFGTAFTAVVSIAVALIGRSSDKEAATKE